MNLPLLTACRLVMLALQALCALGMSLICRPTNQSVKPPFEGVSLSRRLHRETIPNHNQPGRSRVGVLKRTTQYRNTNRLWNMASLSSWTHNQNRINDGQDWLEISHSLPTSKSGQDLPNESK